MKNIRLKKLAMLFICFLLLITLLPINSDAANKLSLNKKKVTLYVGMEAETITVKNLSDKQKVKWTTSNKKIATVKNGKITPKKNGTVTITAKIGKKKLICKVTVKEPKIYSYSYNSKSGYSSSKQEKNSSTRSLYLKVGKDIPAGIYKTTGVYGKKTIDPLVYVGTKKEERVWANWLLHMSNSDPNGDLIEAKKGQWITIRIASDQKTTLTPIKYVKTFDKYSEKVMEKRNYFYATYKVGRDIPAGEYKVDVEYEQVSFKKDSCIIAIADSLYYAKSLRSTSEETYRKLVKESNAKVIGFNDFIGNKEPEPNGSYLKLKIDTTFSLKDGQWICTKVPIYSVN